MAEVVGSPLALVGRQAAFPGRITPHILCVDGSVQIELSFVTEQDVAEVSGGESDQISAHGEAARIILRFQTVTANNFVGMELFLLGKSPPGTFRKAQHISSLRAHRRMRHIKILVSIPCAPSPHTCCIGRSHG